MKNNDLERLGDIWIDIWKPYMKLFRLGGICENKSENEWKIRVRMKIGFRDLKGFKRIWRVLERFGRI